MSSTMAPSRVVSREEWLAPRKELLVKEKELTRARDRLSAERRGLPWVRVEKPYVFDGPVGKVSLADLFEGRSQLIVKHFMLGPGWKEGCVGCSFEVDHVEGALLHLEHHYDLRDWVSDELSGLSVFYRDAAGDVFHTYSCYARGNEGGLSAYAYLDLTPKGRNETGPNHDLSDWVRHHDRYGSGGFVDAGGRYHAPEAADRCCGPEEG